MNTSMGTFVLWPLVLDLHLYINLELSLLVDVFFGKFISYIYKRAFSTYFLLNISKINYVVCIFYLTLSKRFQNNHVY